MWLGGNTHSCCGCVGIKGRFYFEGIQLTLNQTRSQNVVLEFSLFSFVNLVI